ncbi:unnamed protein product, partial [Urochloa humidicola]
PKKKAKKTKTAESSIVPLEDDAPAPSMSFPPPSLDTTCKNMQKNGNSSSGASKRSRSGSNQPTPLSIELPMPDAPPIKQKPKKKKKEPSKKHKAIPVTMLDSPAMGTRSKRMDPGSPAMSTRSKRRLSI